MKKTIEPLSMYWKLMKQTKGQEYYYEYLSKSLKRMELSIQAFIVVATVIGIILMTSELIGPKLKLILLVTTIVSQIITLLYPYLFEFNKKMIMANENRFQLANLCSEMMILYPSISEESDEKILEAYSIFFKKHTEMSARSDQRYYFESRHTKYLEKAAKDSKAFFELYFITEKGDKDEN